MRITSENGHSYNLDAKAVGELRRAKTANTAERVFNRLAPHVSCHDRLGIWFAVDYVPSQLRDYPH